MGFASENSAPRALLSGLIDYAGLFPPAGLGMAETVANYASYVNGSHAWMLGRIIVPAVRLAEFAAAVRDLPAQDAPLPVSALAVSATDAALIAEFKLSCGDCGRVDTVETRAASPEEIAEVAQLFNAPGSNVYVEVCCDETLSTNLDAIARAQARAKVRTGGVKPDMFISPESMARFLLACKERRLAFKATAGLHHMRPSTRALTYEADAPRGRMHGFLNVFGASALLWAGEITREDQIMAILEARDVHLTEDTLEWRGRTANAAQITSARNEFAIAFGSCSFTEPLEELQQEGLV